MMLNSAEHEMLDAHKCKTIKRISFLGSDMAVMVFFLVVNVKIVGILTFMSRKK